MISHLKVNTFRLFHFGYAHTTELFPSKVNSSWLLTQVSTNAYYLHNMNIANSEYLFHSKISLALISEQKLDIHDIFFTTGSNRSYVRWCPSSNGCIGKALEKKTWCFSQRIAARCWPSQFYQSYRLQSRKKLGRTFRTWR